MNQPTPDRDREQRSRYPAKYRNGTLTVEAMRVDTDNIPTAEIFTGGSSRDTSSGLVFDTEHGRLRVRDGQWIIRTGTGDCFTSSDSDFWATHELAEATQDSAPPLPRARGEQK